MGTFSKNQVNFYTVTEKDENQRLDNLLTKLLKGVPKSYIYRVIRSGEVRINKKRADASDKVMFGDVIRIPPVRVSNSLTREKIIPRTVFPVLFEDDYFLIINKPDGVACHGGSGVSFGVIEQIRQNYPKSKFLELVHRLDRNTSGILILAKKRQALVLIQDLIRNKEMKKNYLALTVGCFKDKMRNVKEPLYKFLTKTGERYVKVDHENGKFSQTIFHVVKLYNGFTLVCADIKTGRTHQIRVHLQHIGYPIVGDDKYGDFELNKELIKAGFKRMFLHAYAIEFIHPITQQKIAIRADLPPVLQNFLDTLASN